MWNPATECASGRNVEEAGGARARAVRQNACRRATSLRNELCITYGFHRGPNSSVFRKAGERGGRKVHEPPCLDFIAHHEDRVTNPADHRHTLDGLLGGEKR